MSHYSEFRMTAAHVKKRKIKRMDKFEMYRVKKKQK